MKKKTATNIQLPSNKMPWNDFVAQCLLDFCGFKLQFFLAATDTSMFCLFPNGKCNKSGCFFHLLLGLNIDHQGAVSCVWSLMQFIATPHKYSISNGMTSLHNVYWICDKYKVPFIKKWLNSRQHTEIFYWEINQWIASQ